MAYRKLKMCVTFPRFGEFSVIAASGVLEHSARVTTSNNFETNSMFKFMFKTSYI